MSASLRPMLRFAVRRSLPSSSSSCMQQQQLHSILRNGHTPLRIPTLRPFTTTPHLSSKPITLPPRRIVPESEFTEKFLHGSGPGGQKINKTSSAVQLKHLPTGLVVKCQETRSRTQNRKIARRLLGERLDEMERGEESRTAIKGRVISKRKKSAEKKRKRKYRALEGGKGEVEGEDGDGDGEGEFEGEGVEVTEAEEASRRAMGNGTSVAEDVDNRRDIDATNSKKLP